MVVDQSCGIGYEAGLMGRQAGDTGSVVERVGFVTW